MGILFDKVNRIITVEAPATEVTVQELLNAIRDWEDESINMEVDSVAKAAGKDDLGGGLQVGITLTLLNWKVKFEDRAGPNWVDCVVTGGNLLAEDAVGDPMNPIEPASYVTVTKSTAVSAALIADPAEWTQMEKDDLKANVLRTLGLTQENFYIDQTEYDNEGNMVAARIRIYGSAGDVPGGTPIATYLSSATYFNRRLQTYQVKKA